MARTKNFTLAGLAWCSPANDASASDRTRSSPSKAPFCLLRGRVCRSVSGPAGETSIPARRSQDEGSRPRPMPGHAGQASERSARDASTTPRSDEVPSEADAARRGSGSLGSRGWRDRAIRACWAYELTPCLAALWIPAPGAAPASCAQARAGRSVLAAAGHVGAPGGAEPATRSLQAAGSDRAICARVTAGRDLPDVT